MIDYHTHHRRCGHAIGELEEYVQQAILLGLTEIGLSDHQPVLHLKPPILLPEVAMELEELPYYVEEVLRIKEKYQDQIVVKLGLEADYVRGYEEHTSKLLAAYPFDYVIGSVHFLEDFDLTDYRQMDKWKRQEVGEVCVRYFEAIRESVQSGLFDIVGHMDVVKRFGFVTAEELEPLLQETLTVIAKSGIAVEINSSGLRYPCAEIFPSPSILKKLVELQVPIAIGSDAHRPDQVGMNLEDALRLLQEAGGQEVVGFTKRKRYTAMRF